MPSNVILENGFLGSENPVSPLSMEEGRHLALLSFLTASPHLLFSIMLKIIMITP